MVKTMSISVDVDDNAYLKEISKANGNIPKKTIIKLLIKKLRDGDIKIKFKIK